MHRRRPRHRRPDRARLANISHRTRGRQPNPPPSAPARRTAAIVPCYRVRDHITGVIAGLIPHVDAIFVVDDACPDRTADLIQPGPALHLIVHPVNRGVGAATISGYRAARAAGFDLLLKLDGDGQMDPGQIPRLLAPLRSGQADYAKGNRLATRNDRQAMPHSRQLGNRLISVLIRWITGDFTLTDPMNGFTAITAEALAELNLDALDQRFFFETDLLLHLARQGSRIAQIPMPARYGTETSNLDLTQILKTFPNHILKHLRSRAKKQG